ncbi:MAG: hypothetical protein AAF108_11845 [Planctomycetota bacterium]
MPVRHLFMIVFAFATGSPVAAEPARFHIDATDLPRGLLAGSITIPLKGLELDEGRLALQYPKWVPGVHAPGGPIENLAGFECVDDAGNVLRWKRQGGDANRFLVDVPDDTGVVTVRTRYIVNQPDANSRSIDSFGFEQIGFISPNTVLVLPESARIADYEIDTVLTVPEGWVAEGAMPFTESDTTYTFETASAETLVDTPIMLGEFMRTYDLTTASPVGTPHHAMHVFSEVEGLVDIDPRVLAGYRGMVEQAAKLFGSHPFADYDVLLATSNDLNRNGLEHLKSSFNSIPLDKLTSPDSLTGWDRMLVPHEYVHAWCGKYRRPAGMLTENFHDPKDTELLWVYEGLTQYLGELIEIRSGMGSIEEYRWKLFKRLRWASLRQGRRWRSLADTASSSHLLRGGSRYWSGLRRGQDYYEEGALIWMEADAIIRNGTDNAKSIDDFCKVFFEAPDGDAAPKPYGRGEVVDTLAAVFRYDWDTFFADRVDTVAPNANLSLARELGYTVQYTNEPPEGPAGERIDPLDARDSLGISVRPNGSIATVLLGSPADNIGLAPEMRIQAINGFSWSRQRFADALKGSAIKANLELMMTDGDRYVTKTIEYDNGPRYMTLVRDPEQPDRLTDILTPN